MVEGGVRISYNYLETAEMTVRNDELWFMMSNAPFDVDSQKGIKNEISVMS